MNVLMGNVSLIYFVISHLILFSNCEDAAENNIFMSKEERENLREEARDMFYHAYRAYMDNAYPADELMPLTCQGRYRGSHPSRGDIDDVLGNFSLTLIDTLDTLVILGDLSEFEHAVQLIINDVTFDTDVEVSVFETNIRVLGGLLSGHILAEYIQQKFDIMLWYSGELLMMAKDVGYRLLPAFNTTTGIPHARVNLKYGMKSEKLEESLETCTACAGTMILELAALSRLTGESIFEQKAQHAMDALWRLRHRSSDLMGTVLNVQSGDWIRRDSGVGAGIDSYYEYCLKAYILLGDSKYLTRFNKHYSAVMKYISQGPLLIDVHMHRPNTNSRHFMDSLLAFWPGLQVLNGDLKPAVETHEMLYQVLQRHNFIPEAFTIDFQVHWGQYPLRPEFLESTYFLYKATMDHYYLHVGRKVLRGLQSYARVPCGYAAVSDVRTGRHDDRMDSFVLAETLKYLYLLFAEPSDLLVDIDKFIFTTEAHLLPLALARLPSNYTYFLQQRIEDNDNDMESLKQQCPSSLRLFPDEVRKPLRNMVKHVCPAGKQKIRKLTAQDFQSGNPDHKKLISDMGISITLLDDGRMQLVHTYNNAKSTADAEEGLLFIHEMLELAKAQTAQENTPEAKPKAVIFEGDENESGYTLNAGPAYFGKQFKGNDMVRGKVRVTEPLRACSKITNPEVINGKIAVVQRGDCMFVEKARRLEAAGAIGGIVIDNNSELGPSGSLPPLFAMSGDGVDDVNIPIVFLFLHDAVKLANSLVKNPSYLVTLADQSTEKIVKDTTKDIKEEPSTLDKIKGSVQNFLFNSGQDSVSTDVNTETSTNSDVDDNNEDTSSLKSDDVTQMNQFTNKLHKLLDTKNKLTNKLHELLERLHSFTNYMETNKPNNLKSATAINEKDEL